MPGQFEGILDKLQTKLGKQTIKRASTINRPRPKREVQQIHIFNEFNRRNPKADGGSVNGSEQAAFRAKVEELMDDGYDFGEAVREAMRQGYQDGGRIGFKDGTPVKFDNTRVKIPTGKFVGEGRDKSQIFKIKNNKSGSVKYTTSGAGGGKKKLYNSIEEVKKAKLDFLPDELVKTNAKRIKENIQEVTYKNKKTGKIVTKYKPFIGPDKVTIEGKGANTLKEAEKFVADYFKKNPKQIRVRDPEKDYKSKDIRRQFEKDKQGRTIKFGAKKGYVVHHMLPLAGKADVTDSDLAVISKKMNAELAQFDKPMNALVNEAYALDFSKEGSLKRMNEINKELADILKKAETKLPKKYKGLLGFNKLTPVLGEFDAKGNQVFDIKPVGIDYKKSISQKKKGTPIRDKTTKAIRELVQRAEKIGNIYRSVRPSIDSLTNVIPGKADNAIAAAIDLPMMYISGAPLTQAAGSAASMFMNNPNLGKAINVGLETSALSDEEEFLKRATQRREGIESALKSVPSKFQSFIERNKGPADESFTSYFDGGIVSTLKGVK